MTVQQKKTKFRQSYKWKKLRTRLKAEREVDELTQLPLQAGWSLHHMDLDEAHYTNISDPSKFMCLNRQSHEILHWLLKHSERDPEFLDRLVDICNEHKEINKKGP